MLSNRLSKKGDSSSIPKLLHEVSNTFEPHKSGNRLLIAKTSGISLYYRIYISHESQLNAFPANRAHLISFQVSNPENPQGTYMSTIPWWPQPSSRYHAVNGLGLYFELVVLRAWLSEYFLFCIGRESNVHRITWRKTWYHDTQCLCKSIDRQISYNMQRYLHTVIFHSHFRGVPMHTGRRALLGDLTKAGFHACELVKSTLWI